MFDVTPRIFKETGEKMGRSQVWTLGDSAASALAFLVLCALEPANGWWNAILKLSALILRCFILLFLFLFHTLRTKREFCDFCDFYEGEDIYSLDFLSMQLCKCPAIAMSLHTQTVFLINCNKLQLVYASAL